MQRRFLSTGFATSAASTTLFSRQMLAREIGLKMSNTIDVEINREFTIHVASPQLQLESSKPSLVYLESGILTADKHDRLTATISATIKTYSNVEYRISAALFDDQNSLLGSATNQISIKYVRLGRMGMTYRDIEFDFGCSRTYRNVSRLMLAFNDVDVAKTCEG